MNSLNSNKKRALALLAALTAGGPLFAYETSWFDKKADEKEGQSSFKADGTIFAGYERPDYETNGVLDSNGTLRQTSGFTVSRAYFNFRGEVNEGKWKGAGFRVTVDGGLLANNLVGASNSSTSTGNSGQVAELKFAYFQLPLYATSFGNGSVRVGQQQVAIVDGQAGYSNESYWKHRFIDQNAAEKSGFAGSSADRGISFLHRADYFGLHLFLSNGEGFRRNNAQASFLPTAVNVANNGVLTSAQQTTIRTNLRNLANGNNGTAADSYGYDLYGVPSFKPTGTDKDFEVSIGLPFRFQNVSGIKRQEYEYVAADFSTTAPRADIYSGDGRAKQDRAYGPELAVSYDGGDFKVTIGGGHIFLKDKRGAAWRTDQTGGASLLATQAGRSLPDYTLAYYSDKDARGQSNWAYLHVKFGAFGLLGRHIYGTGSGTLAALPSKSYAEQLVEADLQDSTLGNLSPSVTRGANATIDLGGARFRRETYALTWSPFARLTIAFGMEKLKTTNRDGDRTKVNAMDNIPGVATSTTALSTQVDSFLSTQGTFLTTNDLGGQPRQQKQVFIRTVYEF